MSASSSVLSPVNFFAKALWSKEGTDPKIKYAGDAQLCRRCILIFQKRSMLHSMSSRVTSFGQVDLVLYSKAQSFLKAADAGCFICGHLRYCFTPQEWKQILENYSPLTLTFEVQLCFVAAVGLAHELTFAIGDGTTQSQRKFRLEKKIQSQTLPDFKPDILPSTGSAGSLRLPEFWLRDCLLNHSSCGYSTTGSKENSHTWLPTRILQITKAGARLCSREEMPSPSPSYATLSHCWGKDPIFTATKANIAGLHTSIPLELLPKSFQDAVTICRKLGFEYLWIDSLCIIQDSDEDWRWEAQQMGRVYKHGCLNIAATGFSDGSEGFFTTRNSQSIRPLRVESEGSEFVALGKYHIISNSKWLDEVLNAPLNTRGWVFQERLLSPRVLSFGSREIFWECKEREACESYPQSFPNTVESIEGEISEQRFLKTRNPLDDLEMIENSEDDDVKTIMWEFWSTVVEEYSGMDLTKEEDKLVALSGVITEIEPYLGGECLAGIWRLHLPAQLLWNVPHTAYPSVTRPARPQAPSWSWASLNVRVSVFYKDPDLEESSLLSTLLSASVTVDKAGNFQSGELQFRGPLMEAAMEPSDKTLPSKHLIKLQDMPRLRVFIRGPAGVEHLLICVSLLPDDVREWDKKWSAYFQRPWEDTRENSSSDFAQWPKLMQPSGGFPDRIFLLPLIVAQTEIEKSRNRRISDSLGFQGLILLPCGEPDGVFKRIGMFSSLIGQEDNVALQDILRCRLALRMESYQRREGENNVVISII